ncbi:MAG: glutamate-5-semialdehyde dehydrogenase [Dehalococcoidia bacterium]|jgi:glutamate-5-semialdehyde dehydrogenase|nr:glutamate-5-semialdehyde dehydrogenase [Dehalococcoidia bacterium]MDP6226209.1 glutamate-5-semialdehyde dehydrogenase [Dehalococcoidia bacterium]MDP7085250.1 glutamate-5-semialdehyde dehydrogenase [Dehalococcoidia bacterium]MDP7200608.1 glutamate-5-semialdehyde dehydrogenase [Dehalococcoidia bacterium]MDP7509917.1 glutamate-5-semialdehyde dehydrogenase [Dehalococcoidia bacterium]
MTIETVDALVAKGRAARAASRQVARLSTRIKDRALLNIAEALETGQSPVLAANRRDHEAARSNGLDEAMLDRLLLTPERLQDIARDVRAVAALPDPIGETMDMTTLPNGLRVGKRRVPLGVVGSIYESRPNVTIDIAVLCLKSGNACLLRGGKESLHSNTALVKLVREAIAEAGVPPEAVQFIDNPDRALVDAMLRMKEHIDLLVPRGGAELVRFVANNAAMPAVTGGIGVCHTYVDRGADVGMAADIIFNAKVQRPTVCNALDTVLVHSDVAPRCLPRIARELAAAGVELHCDHRALSILGPSPLGEGELPMGKVLPAVEDDWGQEFLSLTAAVKVVDSLEEALQHIETYGSGHSEAIITEDYSAAMRFLEEVDAAAVFVNASTRFTDGAQFGLGAEVGISTQKLHARGPMGLRELTSYKWVILGNGQVRY